MLNNVRQTTRGITFNLPTKRTRVYKKNFKVTSPLTHGRSLFYPRLCRNKYFGKRSTQEEKTLKYFAPC